MGILLGPGDFAMEGGGYACHVLVMDWGSRIETGFGVMW